METNMNNGQYKIHTITIQTLYTKIGQIWGDNAFCLNFGYSALASGHNQYSA